MFVYFVDQSPVVNLIYSEKHHFIIQKMLLQPLHAPCILQAAVQAHISTAVNYTIITVTLAVSKAVG
jgi:hypothetical protein